MINGGHILTAAEMLAAEEKLVADGVSIAELMQRAGQGAAQQIWRIFGNQPALVLCGPGNNGGDGYVIAEWLRNKGTSVTVAQAAEPKTDAAQNAKSHWQGETISIFEAQPAKIVIDCLFGTGLKRPVEGDLLKSYLRLCDAAGASVAIDIPSGIETDSGELLNDIPQFDHTIALGAFKPAHVLEPVRSLMGKISGVTIGIDAVSNLETLTRPDILAPGPSDHKYARGLVAVVAGEMPGAASLTAMAAQESGAGYVKLFAPEGFQSPKSSIVVDNYRDENELSELLSDSRISSIAVGPGLGLSDQSKSILDIVLKNQSPLVLDADALSLLGLEFADTIKARRGGTVATPHQGEFERVSDMNSSNKIEVCGKLAAVSGATILYKGSDSVVADREGNAAVSTEACHWLSTAGTGDVLTGIVAARLASGMDAFTAAKQSQWLHTRAAQLSGPAFSPDKMTAKIPAAISECL